jgi:DNA replication protein DnaD
LEEYDFFDEMCLVALDISKEVKFAAVTDTNGKLIAGKQCKDDKINNSLVKTRLTQSSSAKAKENRQNSINSTTTTYCHYNTNYIFYANYLASTLKRIKNDMQCTVSKGQDPVHRIELVQIHGLLKIAITSLTARNDRYLCIYLESSSSDQEIITKILNAI